MIFFHFISEDLSYLISFSITHLSRHFAKRDLIVVRYLLLMILIKLEKNPRWRTTKLVFKSDFGEVI